MSRAEPGLPNADRQEPQDGDKALPASVSPCSQTTQALPGCLTLTTKRPDAGRQDRGSGTIYVLAMVTVVVLLTSAGLALAQALIARHRAAAAADLSAISAASRVLDGPAGACEAATVVARSQGARLTMCRIDGEVAEVTVVVQSGFLSVHYPATGAARAGPADPTLSNP